MQPCGLHGLLLSNKQVKKCSNNKQLNISLILVDIISKQTLFSRVYQCVSFLLAAMNVFSDVLISPAMYWIVSKYFPGVLKAICFRHFLCSFRITYENINIDVHISSKFPLFFFFLLFQLSLRESTPWKEVNNSILLPSEMKFIRITKDQALTWDHW